VKIVRIRTNFNRNENWPEKKRQSKFRINAMNKIIKLLLKAVTVRKVAVKRSIVNVLVEEPSVLGRASALIVAIRRVRNCRLLWRI
jgi:hypothetical protein